MVCPFLFPLILSISLLDQTDTSELDMRKHFVIDPLSGKRQQLLLAMQLCRMELKVCIFLSISFLLSIHSENAQLNRFFLFFPLKRVNQVIIAGSDENEF